MSLPFRTFCSAAALLLLAACAPRIDRIHADFDQHLRQRSTTLPLDLASCRKRGGQWLDEPRMRCVPPDAGQKCLSVQECQGLCELPGAPPRRLGDRAVGECSAFYGISDCASLVHQGRYFARICI